VLSYLSANRDEKVFEAPEAFKVERPAGSLALGYRAHGCLGLHRAELESRVLWEEPLPRLKAVELTGASQSVRANFITSIGTLQIRCHIGLIHRRSVVQPIPKAPSHTHPG
jgi:hypothetical protein